MVMIYSNSMDFSIEERIEKAEQLFRSGYNCCQSVFMAYSDLYQIDETFAATLSAPLGGGIGRLREVCGTVSGMALLAGLQYPAPDAAITPDAKAAKTKVYTVVQELAEKFRLENGAIVCRDLLGLAQQKDDPVPSDRTETYYKRRPCVEYVKIAARIVGENLRKENQENNK